ncbi:MAG: 2Fe-2S iron-sulfur cluster-binding protein, partial [bacterium]
MAEKGDILLSVLQDEGVHIEALCGGKGICGKCRVILDKGKVEKRSDIPDKLLSHEELEAGYHLACMTRLVEDCEFTIPLESRVENPKILISTELNIPEIKPAVTKHLLESKPKSSSNLLLSYRKLNLIGYKGTAPRVSDEVYDQINKIKGDKITVTVSRTDEYPEVINVEEGDTTDRNYGLAIDIGTTTIVAILVDINTGEILGKGSGMNKQITYGEDLVTRTAIARDPEGLKKLQKVVVDAINEIITKLLKETDVKPEEVNETTVGANTVMNHLFSGLESGY